jgi:hypothetical protein
MATAGGSIALKVSKSTLSMFLRTKCDKELFLSLHEKTAMAGAGLPEPIKRPGIGILAVEGKEFEVARNDQLVRLVGGIVQYSKKASQYGNLELQAVLNSVGAVPQLVLQGHFSISAQQSAVLAAIGLGPADIALVPPIADFIPDILYIREAKVGDQEVLPDGTRGPINQLLLGNRHVCGDAFELAAGKTRVGFSFLRQPGRKAMDPPQPSRQSARWLGEPRRC